MGVDYAETCGACSSPLSGPPRDGADSMCGYLHTRAGRREFKRTLERNLKRQKVVDAVTHPVTKASEVVTEEANPVTESPIVVTDTEAVTDAVTDSESKQQRYRRLNRERINERERDRRGQ